MIDSCLLHLIGLAAVWVEPLCQADSGSRQSHTLVMLRPQRTLWLYCFAVSGCCNGSPSICSNYCICLH